MINSQTVAIEQLVAELQDVHTTLYNAINDLGSPLAEVVRARLPYIMPLRRGALVLTAGFKAHNGSDNRSQRIQLAAAIEMLYLALNVHQLLLSTPAVHRSSGSDELHIHGDSQPDKSFIASTILAGDYCFSRSAQMAAQTQNPIVVASFAQALQSISEGLLRRLFHHEEPDFDVQQALLYSGAQAAVELAALPSDAKDTAIGLALEIVATATLPPYGATLVAMFPTSYQIRWFALAQWTRQHYTAISPHTSG